MTTAINMGQFFEQTGTLTGRKVLLLIAVILMTACSTTPQTPLPPTQLAENIDIRNWYIKGKIGLKDGKEAHSAYLNWLQCGEDYDIRVTGPFGQGAAHLFGNDKLASLETADSQTSQARNAEQLLSRQLGWSFPVTELLYWLRGIPSPMLSYSVQDQLTSFQQSDWQLSFPRLKTVDEYQLPTKIIASQDPLKITLIVKQWQLQPDCSRL